MNERDKGRLIDIINFAQEANDLLNALVKGVLKSLEKRQVRSARDS
jgi:hypothetical protein